MRKPFRLTRLSKRILAKSEAVRQIKTKLRSKRLHNPFLKWSMLKRKNTRKYAPKKAFLWKKHRPETRKHKLNLLEYLNKKPVRC